MALKDTMLSTANRMIQQYGSSVVLKKKITTGKIYNPITDEFEGIDSSIEASVNAIQSKKDVGDDTLAEIQSVKEILLLEYSNEIEGLDNTWTCNGRKIYHVKTTSVQGQDILYRIYVG